MLDRSLFDLPGIKKTLLVLTGIACLISMAILGQSWALARALTNLWQGEALFDQLLLIAGFFLCFVSVQLIQNIQDSYLDSYAYKQAQFLRQQLLRTVFALGPELVQEEGTGSTVSLLIEGVEQVENYLRIILRKMVHLIIIPLLLLIPLFILDWVSGVAICIVFPFIVLYMVILGRTAQDKARTQHHEFKRLSNHFINSLRGIDTLKLFGVSKQHGKNIYAVSERFRKATIKTLRIATLSGSVLDLFATLSVAAVAILLGLRLLDGSLSLFPALTILILAPECFKPLREFASDFHTSLDGKNALSSMQRILKEYGQIMEEQETELSAHSKTPLEPMDKAIAFKGNPIVFDQGISQAFATADSNVSIEQVSSKQLSISVRELLFCYTDFEALHKISFEASMPTKVGIVGASGAGKSTLLHILSGFAEPSSGQIHINDQVVSSFRQHEWQRQLAYLPQNPYIFHTTLRENLCFYTPDATKAEVKQAVEAAGLQGLINELPLGLDTVIGEGERSLSGGQAQRVALARIFLDERRRVLLFDEPTAHLDIETEYELKHRMLPLMQNRLVFFATHRLHWMNEMDYILVIDKGMIVQSGTLSELCNNEGPFLSLVRQEDGELT